MSSTVKDSDVAVIEKEKIKEPSKYHVIVHDNNDTSYDEVVYVLSNAFEMSQEDAFNIARRVDTTGQGICGTYSKEIAETKIQLTDMIKDSLAAIMPHRVVQIKMLKFTMEKA